MLSSCKACRAVTARARGVTREDDEEEEEDDDEEIWPDASICVSLPKRTVAAADEEDEEDEDEDDESFAVGEAS
jgi:hypothetical protein